MNIALIGYGRMGQEIEKILLRRDHRVVLIVDERNMAGFNADTLRDSGAEVAIEFTVPGAAAGNITTCIEAGVPVVCGTTGWHDSYQRIAELCRSKNGTLFYSSNFSVGVNIMFRVNEVLARIMDSQDRYDVTVEETHHTGKKDAPGGTAVTLAEGIVGNVARKREWVGEPTTETDLLGVTSTRRGTVTGIHTVTYDSPEDYIQLTHYAKSRAGFAEGAVLAAEFAARNKGILTMKDLLGF